jgi:hypothetical protein
MSDTRITRVMKFEKHGPQGIAHCEMQVYGDGSAYVRGDGIEVIFDDAPDAWTNALPYLESRGYTKVAEKDAGGPPEG